MQKILLFTVCVCVLGAAAFGVASIQFTPGGASPGEWVYDGAGTFSFVQDVVVDLCEGGTSDSLVNSFVYVPDLVVAYVGGQWVVTPQGPVEIKDSSSNVLMSGTLAQGTMIPIYTTSVWYADIAVDISDITIDNTIGSDVLAKIEAVGLLDMNLTLQAPKNFETILNGSSVERDGFSGSMTIIPEPATLCLVAAGAAGLLAKKRRL